MILNSKMGLGRNMHRGLKRMALLLPLGFFCVSTMEVNGQEPHYHIQGGTVSKVHFTDLQSNLSFQNKIAENPEVFNLGLAQLVGNVIPFLVDGASKLFYDPDNYNKEYRTQYPFFDGKGKFMPLQPGTMMFERTGIDEQGKKETLSQFTFTLGAVENVEGYFYMGLQSFSLAHVWARLSSAKNTMNYVVDVGFYYFDDDDRPQEFHLNPIVLENIKVPAQKELKTPAYQIVPQMKVLQRIQVRIREVNASKQNWDQYLELYQSNSDQISRFLIRAIQN
jgi:hypothetical protein